MKHLWEYYSKAPKYFKNGAPLEVFYKCINCNIFASVYYNKKYKKLLVTYSYIPYLYLNGNYDYHNKLYRSLNNNHVERCDRKAIETMVRFNNLLI